MKLVSDWLQLKSLSYLFFSSTYDTFIADSFLMTVCSKRGQKFQTTWKPHRMLFHTYFVHLDLHLQLQIGGNLLHVLHSVSGEVAVGQEHTANTLQSSTRCGHIPWVPVFHWLQANSVILFRYWTEYYLIRTVVFKTYEPGQCRAQYGKE